jgi:hypothetical protein
MSDHDRRLADIEKRLARLEKLEAMRWRRGYDSLVGQPPSLNQVGEQWCECGRDVCRAPDCPSHKPDPLGR